MKEKKVRKPRIYEDDLLKSRCFRLSTRHELTYVKEFIDILRRHRDIAIEFIMMYSRNL